MVDKLSQIEKDRILQNHHHAELLYDILTPIHADDADISLEFDVPLCSSTPDRQSRYDELTNLDKLIVCRRDRSDKEVFFKGMNMVF